MIRTEKAERKYKVSSKEAVKLIVRHTRKRVTEQIKAVSLIIIYLILFQTLILGIPITNSATIALGLVLVVLGLSFFMEGLLLGLMPLGEVIGIKLPLKTNLFVILVIAFLLGLGATFAEPAIGVLRVAGQSVNAWSSPLLFLLLNKYASYLVYSVGIGVGIAVVLAMLRFLYGWSLKPFIYVWVSILMVLSFIAYLNPNLNHILGLAWDCGGVTTGPVTVPLILALGIGISHVSNKGRNNNGYGFGAVTLASLLPVASVLLIGMLFVNKVPQPMDARDFFKPENRTKSSYLFNNESQMIGYALKHATQDCWLDFFDGDQDKLVKYLHQLDSDEDLIKELFGSRVKFNSWIVNQTDHTLKLKLLGSEDGIAQLSENIEANPTSNVNTFSFLKSNIIHASQAIIPLSMFLLFVLFIVLRDKLPKADEIFLGLFFALIGMAIFNGGIDLGLSKVSDQVGGNLPASFTSIEIPQDQTIIKGFDDKVVNTAISPDGTSRNFFYYYHKNSYTAVPYNPNHYYSQQKLYKHIPIRSVICSRERSIIGFMVVLLFAFVMGYGSTLAEPALNALGLSVEDLTVGTFKKSLLIQAVAIGVGVGVSAGLAKIIWNLPLFWMLVFPYLILLVMSKISSEEFVNIGWDSAGVTTGPITVPLVLAMGLGTGSQIGVVEGFGILSLASVCPIIAVLTVGLVVSYKRKKILRELTEEQGDSFVEEVDYE